MFYLIIAQIARGAVIWTTNSLGRKILKTITVGAITFYLIDKNEQYKKKMNERK